MHLLVAGAPRGSPWGSNWLSIAWKNYVASGHHIWSEEPLSGEQYIVHKIEGHRSCRGHLGVKLPSNTLRFPDLVRRITIHVAIHRLYISGSLVMQRAFRGQSADKHSTVTRLVRRVTAKMEELWLTWLTALKVQRTSRGPHASCCYEPWLPHFPYLKAFTLFPLIPGLPQIPPPPMPKIGHINYCILPYPELFAGFLSCG